MTLIENSGTDFSMGSSAKEGNVSAPHIATVDRSAANNMQTNPSVGASANSRRAKGSHRRRLLRKLPPGQRLLLYVGLAGLLTLLQGRSQPAEVPQAEVAPLCHTAVDVKPPFHMQKELTDLEAALKSQATKPRLRTGLFLVEPDSGCYADVSGQESFAAASMIKVPVLVALLMAMDRKQVSSAQMLTLRADLMAGGSGYLQWRPLGTQVSVDEAARLMIINSDNTATNLIIDLLGGPQVLDAQFQAWGLKRTKINNLLPDFDGTNQTSPYDLAYLLGVTSQGGLISAESKQFMYDIMQKTRTRTLLPPGLGLGAKIAHKTGDIGGMVGDAGIVTAPSGKRYIVVAQVERPHNDRRANELIRELSRTVYASLIPDASFPPLEPQPARAVKVKIHHSRKHRRHQA
jgi:beta-lactamase class A